jgi:hypothetical protein
MKFRWTTEELTNGTDAWILRGLVNERVSDLNPSAPLAMRLRKIRDKLDAQVQAEGERVSA